MCNIKGNNEPKPDFAMLVPAAQNGGQRAMLAICSAFRPLILNLLKQSRFAPIRDDAASIVYACIIRCVVNYEGTSFDRFPGYIKKMAYFDLNNALRKETNFIKHVSCIDDAVLDAISGETIEDSWVRSLSELEALKHLPLHYLRILLWYYKFGLTLTEIGERLGVSHQAVSHMKTAALKRLKKELEA
ncbi:MAG TPA: sigma-70 family RNA polymerase sigma factor [Candidatus Avacidaminococcus intestinavium]|uniref:Sigma-70 family RNA polymerase sigma factor n=1 Tax=Candidatus Avacidaminococcus intestinavium TaxID=2840684 RepID=A0A9D1MPB4_9FIRM|nr:sigma-70 family RNA polymerase sigma factor [Candidatus Avacidaminococcus intestinavium]